MTNSIDDRTRRPQAEVTDDLDGAGTLYGRAGASVFSIGGPDGSGGTAAGANPYELLSASLAACTAMTIRLQARRRKIPLAPRRGSCVVPPWRGRWPRLLRALDQARRKPWQ